MLNIFAEALLIATRMGHLERPTRHTRRSPREFQDVDGLRADDRLPMRGR